MKYFIIFFLFFCAISFGMDVEHGQICHKCFVCGNEIKKGEDFLILSCGHRVHPRHWYMWNESIVPHLRNYCRICTKLVFVREEPLGCCGLFKKFFIQLSRDVKRACASDNFEFKDFLYE
jgi:hypothetical protein